MDHTDKSSNGCLTIEQKRVMIYFIKATEILIQRGGIENLSIRKIAAEAGYTSETIYHYFNDLDELIMFGSICYLREYVIQLQKALKPCQRAIDRYCIIYHCFNRYARKYPDIYLWYQKNIVGN